MTRQKEDVTIYDDLKEARKQLERTETAITRARNNQKALGHLNALKERLERKMTIIKNAIEKYERFYAP